MQDKKRAFVKEIHFFRKLLILILCITLLSVNTLSTLSANAATDNTEEELESVEDTSETTSKKETETAKENETETAEEITDAKQTEDVQVGDTEKVTANESEEETVSETEETPDTEVPITLVSNRDGQTEVGTWDQFKAALADETVDSILLTANISRVGLGTNTATDPGSISRTLIIDGGTAGYSINFGTATSTTSSILLGAVTGDTYLTLNNVTLIKGSGQANAMFTSSTGGANWNIFLNNVKTNTSITGTANAAGLVNAANASVTVYGTENDLSFYSAGGSLFNVGSFSMAEGSAMTATARSTGRLFKVNSGDFTMVSGTVLTAKSTIGSTDTNLYSFDIDGNIIIGANCQMTADANGSSLFRVGGNFVTEEGSTTLSAKNTNTGQTNYQFNIGGNFVLGKGTNFSTSTASTTSTSAAGSLYQVNVAGELIMGEGTKLTAESNQKPLIKAKKFVVGENAILSAKSTGTSSASRHQFNIVDDFIMKTGSAFTVTTATTSNNNNYYSVITGGNFTMESYTTLEAGSAGMSLFSIAGDFTVGEHGKVTVNTTNGTNRQFFVKNFVAKANATVTTTSVGATYQFYITGNFTMESNGTEGTGAYLTADSSGSSTNSIIYMLGSGTIDLGKYTKTYIRNSGGSGSENDNAPANSHGIYGEIGALNMQANSLLDVYATAVGYRTMVENSFTMVGGAIFNATGVRQSAIALTEDYDNSNRMPATINIDGEGTQLNLECSSTQEINQGAAMVVAGTNNAGVSSVFNLTNGAELNGHATSNTVLQVRSNGSTFTVKDGARLNLVQDGESYALGATLRFRIAGNQAFIIDNAEVNIQKLSGSAPAIRLYGGRNSITVLNGGVFKVNNKGNGSANNGSGNAGNQGIYYTDGSTSRPDSFSVSGYGSKVEIIADYGPAIYNDRGASSITVNKQAIFIATGRTSSATNGVINSSGPATIVLDSPMYFDIRNNRPNGGNAIDANNSSSTFTTKQSDLSVWRKGSDLDGNPSATWSLFDYSLGGSDFRNILSTNVPDEFNTSTYGKASDYSRISANNAAAVIDEIRISTNADKYIYGHAYVPEGLDSQRDAWSYEVYVTVQVKDTIGNIVFTGTGTTIGAANDDSSEGLSIYDEPERAGMFEIMYDPDKDKNGDYIPQGYTIEVIAAWRGGDNSTSDRVHTSTADDLKASAVTTVDVTPPTAITVDDIDRSVKMYDGDLTTRVTQISGTSEEVGATIYLYHKRDGVWSIWANGVVEADQTWSIPLPNALEEGDTVAIALNDDVPNVNTLTSYDIDKLVNYGIYANNGNENPSGEQTFHDAVFSSRLELSVVYYGVLELTVSPEIEYGTHGISPGKSSYPAGAMVLQVEDSRLIKKEWELMAELEKPFTLNGGEDVLNIDLVYAYNGTETIIGDTAVSIWRHTNFNDVFDVYDQWDIAESANGLFIKASAGDVKTGSYTAVINWVLSDVP